MNELMPEREQKVFKCWLISKTWVKECSPVSCSIRNNASLHARSWKSWAAAKGGNKSYLNEQWLFSSTGIHNHSHRFSITIKFKGGNPLFNFIPCVGASFDDSIKNCISIKSQLMAKNNFRDVGQLTQNTIICWRRGRTQLSWEAHFLNQNLKM